MSPSGALAIAALLLFALVLALGAHVARRPLGSLDARAVYFRGQAMPLAIVFTLSGRSRALSIGYVIAIAAFAAARWPIWIPILLAVSQVLSQIVAELLKRIYRRVRPDYWLVGLEAGHSYPSGHATTAVVTFLGWALVIAFGSLPPYAKYALIAIFAIWAAGIAWSRLALGAHYLSDVAGGLLVGSAWLCAMLALLLRSQAVK